MSKGDALGDSKNEKTEHQFSSSSQLNEGNLVNVQQHDCHLSREGLSFGPAASIFSCYPRRTSVFRVTGQPKLSYRTSEDMSALVCLSASVSCPGNLSITRRTSWHLGMHCISQILWRDRPGQVGSSSSGFAPFPGRLFYIWSLLTTFLFSIESDKLSFQVRRKKNHTGCHSSTDIPNDPSWSLEGSPATSWWFLVRLLF